MKILLSVTTIITLAAGSALLSAQADESVERAVHYFGMARKHADSGWSKMASDQAARGLSLLELDNMQYMQSSDAQM